MRSVVALLALLLATTPAAAQRATQLNVNSATPNTATGEITISAPDGATQAILGYVPGNISPVEIPTLLPGITGAGATLLCGSASNASVNCNIIAQGYGNIIRGNGDGYFWQDLDPGAPVSAYMTVTPGTAGATYVDTVIFKAKPTANSATQVANIQINSTSGGVGIGQSGKAQGQQCVALGNGGQCYGYASVVSGSAPYDYVAIGVRCHQSQYAPSAGAGTNQFCEQTLQTTITNASAKRMTYDGSTGGGNSSVMPIAANGHGTFKLDVECTDTTTGDSALWFVTGSFVRVVAALRLPYTSGTGAILNTGAAGVLATMTLAVTADTTNNNINVSPTPPSGNTHTIACGARAEWMQRLP